VVVSDDVTGVKVFSSLFVDVIVSSFNDVTSLSQLLSVRVVCVLLLSSSLNIYWP